MGRSWTKEKVRDEILGLHKATGKINSNFAQVHYRNLYGAVVRLFGSWQKAVEAAGFNYADVRIRNPFRKWSRKAIVAEIKRRQKRGLALNAREVCKDDYALYKAAKRYFGRGGWDKALRKIGLSSYSLYANRIWTKPKVVAAIQGLYTEGSPLYAYYLQRNGHASLVTGGVKVFGSWHKAIEAAGYKYEDIRAVRQGYWTHATVIKEIKRLEKLGVRLSSKATQKTRGDLFGSAIIHFGSWSQAVEAAGINYRKHALVWSTKAWLRKLSEAEVKDIIQKSKTLVKKRRGR